MKKKCKNKIPAVDNSPPIVPNIEPQLQKKVSDELIKGFEWYFPNEHSTYRELIDRWFLPVSFISLLKRRDSHLKKLENPKVRFKNIVQDEVKQCEMILNMIIKRWIEHDFELIDKMNAFKPTLRSESDNVTQQSNKNGSPKANQTYIDEQDNNIIRNDGKAEQRNAVEIIKKQKRQLRALKLHRHKPTQMEMKEIIDRCRFKNDKCNNTKVGEALGIHPDTAKAWIKQSGLSDYAWNPKHLQ